MTDAQLGVQSAATCNVAFGTETTSGVAASAPTVYPILGGDIKPVTKKTVNSKDIVGAMFPSLGYKGIETFEMPLPMLPVLEDTTSPVRRNGLGELYLYMFGANSAAQCASTTAWDKTFTWETLMRTFTAWLHYGTNINEKIRMCAVDNLALKIKADGELSQDFKAMGADLWDVLDADYGSATPASMATAKQLTGMGTRLEFGQPNATVRNAWDEISLDFKRNLSYGAPGKAGQHPAGSGSPQIVTSAKSNIEMGISLRDLDREEIKRGREGGNVAPTASRQNDLYSLVKARLSIFGGAIAAGINGEADYCNAGTMAATFAGSYSGGSTIEAGEIEVEHAPSTYVTEVIENGHMFFRAKTTGVTIHIDVPAGAGATLSCSVATKEVDVVCATGDAGVGISTAAQICAIINATPAAFALMDAGVAEGSTGTGVILADVVSQSLAAGIVDIFRYRSTTGTGWGAWSGWRYVTKAAQTISSGITVAMDDDDNCVTGDKFYYCSHYRYMLRFILPDMNYADAVNTVFSAGVRKADIKLYHPNTGTDPTMVLRDTRATAYT